MPIYLDPLNGISQSEAFAEAAEAAPITRAMLGAYEMWHPSMTAPVRVVVDEVGMTATLEGDAPRNPGEDVFFKPSHIKVQRPEESDQAAAPEITLQVDNVTGYIADALRTARDDPDPAVRDAPWQLIERWYASDDLTGPAVLPVFKITPIRVTMQGPTAVFTCSYRPSVDTSIPRATFTPEAYPGLVA